VAKRDEPSVGIKVLEHKERGFNPVSSQVIFFPLIGQLQTILRVVYTSFRTNHARRIIAKIIRDLPLKAKKDKFFYFYFVRIKKRFNALYELEDAGEINSSIGQIKRELKLFYTQERRKWASPCLDFIEKNSKGLFLYKKLPEKEIEHTNNTAEIIFSLFKPQYKVMKEFQIPHGTQAHFNLFTLRHNFRAFPRGKGKRIFSYLT